MGDTGRGCDRLRGLGGAARLLRFWLQVAKNRRPLTIIVGRQRPINHCKQKTKWPRLLKCRWGQHLRWSRHQNKAKNETMPSSSYTTLDAAEANARARLRAQDKKFCRMVRL